MLHHRWITHETILGALCTYVLVGLLFAFVFLAAADLRSSSFFAQPGPHQQSEYLYFSFVTLTTLGFGDLSPAVGLPQAIVALEALLGQVFRHARRATRDPLGSPDRPTGLAAQPCGTAVPEKLPAAVKAGRPPDRLKFDRDPTEGLAVSDTTTIETEVRTFLTDNFPLSAGFEYAGVRLADRGRGDRLHRVCSS